MFGFENAFHCTTLIIQTNNPILTYSSTKLYPQLLKQIRPPIIIYLYYFLFLSLLVNNEHINCFPLNYTTTEGKKKLVTISLPLMISR